jgi:hypothetical protein
MGSIGAIMDVRNVRFFDFAKEGTMNAALAIAVCTLVGAAPNASVAETKKVDGYEGYKFGMTLEQALKVRPYAKQIQCDYDDATTLYRVPDNYFRLPCHGDSSISPYQSVIT